MCVICEKWVHKRCSGVKGSVYTASLTSVCSGSDDNLVDIGCRIGKVVKFCYLGNMLEPGEGYDSALTAGS